VGQRCLTREGGRIMHAPLIAAIIVFVLNAAGSFIELNNRFVNALVDTVLFVGALIHFGYLHMDFSGTPIPAAVH
jgi:hypothetical protein